MIKFNSKHTLHCLYQAAYLNLMVSLFEKNKDLEKLNIKYLYEYNLFFQMLRKETIKKICILAIKSIANCEKEDMKKNPKMIYDTCYIGILGLRFLNVHDIVNLFPINKNYNGEKFGIKDYFSAKKTVEKYSDRKDFLDMDFTEFEEVLSNLNSDVLFSFLIRKYNITKMSEEINKDYYKTMFQLILKKRFKEVIPLTFGGSE